MWKHKAWFNHVWFWRVQHWNSQCTLQWILDNAGLLKVKDGVASLCMMAINTLDGSSLDTPLIAFFMLWCASYGLSPQSWTPFRDKIHKFIAVSEHPLSVERPISSRTPSLDGDRWTDGIMILSSSIHVHRWPVGQPLDNHWSTICQQLMDWPRPQGVNGVMSTVRVVDW